MDKRILVTLQVFLVTLFIVYVIGSLYNGTFIAFDWPLDSRKMATLIITGVTILTFLNLV